MPVIGRRLQLTSSVNDLQSNLNNLRSANLTVVRLYACATEYNSPLAGKTLTLCARQISVWNVANDSRERAGARGSVAGCVITANRDLARLLRFDH